MLQFDFKCVINILRSTAKLLYYITILSVQLYTSLISEYHSGTSLQLCVVDCTQIYSTLNLSKLFMLSVPYNILKRVSSELIRSKILSAQVL